MTPFSLVKAAAVLALGLALEAGFLLHAATPAPAARSSRTATMIVRPATTAPAALARCADGSFSSRCG
jgi:hypothetical protein